MILHEFLVNPILQTTMMEDEDFNKYVEICNRQVGPTNPDLRDEIERQFYEYARGKEVPEERIAKIWGFVGVKVVKNEGLARFILDYDGTRSDYFFPWLINVEKSPSAALEMAYGAGENLAGNWDKNIQDSDDPIVFFIKNDPTFVYNRERELLMAELVSRVKDVSRLKAKIPKIVDLGAGRLAWARWHGARLNSSEQEIYAFDRDPSINPEKLFESPLEELGINYKHGDLFAQLGNYICREANLLSVLGLVSYLPRDAFSTKVLPTIYALLQPGGTFFFDLQLDCPYYRRSMKLWDWPEIDLEKDVASGVAAIEKIRKGLWQKECKFSAEYIPDTYNNTPSSLMIVMTKL